MDTEIKNEIEKYIEDLLFLNNCKNMWLSIDLLDFIIRVEIRKKIKLNKILDTIFLSLLKYGKNLDNLYISAFTNNFPKTKSFDSINSMPYIGSLSKFIFKQKYQFRTLHPFFSFYNFGFKKNESLDNKLFDSCGENSIFEYMIRNNFKLITAGHHYVKSFPIVHHFENTLGVDYREKVFFSGVITDRKNSFNGEFNYFMRKLNICDGSGLTFLALSQLEEKGIVKTIKNSCLGKNIFGYWVDLQCCSKYLLDNNSRDNVLLDYFHNINFRNKNFVYFTDAIRSYNMLYK